MMVKLGENQIAEGKQRCLERFGFSFKLGGAHSSRTMMLDELSVLLGYVGEPSADRKRYEEVIEQENCLGKRSGITRRLTYRHLVDLYSLDPETTLFRVLLYFWERDVEGRPLLALLCVYARDSIFRTTASFILKRPPGAVVSRQAMEELLEAGHPNRFSPVTLKSMAQNINSTWTKSGHLFGRAKKIRNRAEGTVGSLSFALFLGYLTGARGESLFESEFVKLLELSVEEAMGLAERASQKGWIVFKRIGSIVEVLFPKLLNQREMEWLHE